MTDSTILLATAVGAIFLIMYVYLIRRYSRIKDKASLYFAIACFFWTLASDLGVLMEISVAQHRLFSAALLLQASTVSGILAYSFLNFFAVIMIKPKEKMHGIWIAFIPALAVTFIVLVFNPVPETSNGITAFTLTSMYKAPYGLPLTETVVTLMILMVFYPTHLFFRIARHTKERIIKIKSLLMGGGLFIGTTAYAIAVTDAISYSYVPVWRAIIYALAIVGVFTIGFAYMMPKRIERAFVGRTPQGAEVVRSFVEEFFAHPLAHSERTQLHPFSKTLGLDHHDIVGRKILLEFDPASQYEELVRDFVALALANVEPIVIFTRRGSAIHSYLSEDKAVKFLCLTQQVSVPKEISENEMLLPLNETSLMLDVFDKTSMAYPQGKINIVFDSLSDLVSSIGFEKTYYFVRYATELLVSPRITALFLLNQTAHDPKVASSLRGLFSNQVSIRKDGIEAVKLPKADVGTTETEKMHTK